MIEVMDKISIVQKYIDRCAEESTIEPAKKLKYNDKVGNVLKYIADKGIEVGIAAFHYQVEISKLIQTM